MIYIAIPSGRQEKSILSKLGIMMDKDQELSKQVYLEKIDNHFKSCLSIDSLQVKVLKAGDIPMHVSSNGFDFGITGQDWVREYRCQFPKSAIEELLPLGVGKVRIVAAIHEAIPIESILDLKEFLNSFRSKEYFRIGSEYVNIADHYAKEYKLYRYRIIKTSGSTESLIPEDAEMIVENTQTGETLKKNCLKIIHTFFESEGCLIYNKLSPNINPEILDRVKVYFTEKFMK
ncbi:MAG: ATP phosphoribosyltransferase [Leptospiraceae bacterium]|nr:ATP phosphoribosyltransferase [Leptospiraceae bacterium]MCP5493030.1 ATP phosphoribosyltransferase [Leptospiraceae bacterium]